MFPYQTEKEINGWFLKNEGKIYYYLTNLFVNKNILEIGSYQGLSLSYIENTKNNIYAIEPNKIHFEILKKNIDKFFKNKKITLFNEFSMDICKKIPDEFFNLIFIDADHSYKSVSDDIIFWTKKLKKYSILAGHDYDNFWVGVRDSVNDIIKKENILLVQRVWYTFWDGKRYCKPTNQIISKYLIKKFKML